MTITFDKSAKSLILDSFEKKANDAGIVVEKKDPEQTVIAQDGQELTLEQFAGIKKGSEVYIKSDLPSLIKLHDSNNELCR